MGDRNYDQILVTFLWGSKFKFRKNVQCPAQWSPCRLPASTWIGVGYLCLTPEVSTLESWVEILTTRKISASAFILQRERTLYDSSLVKLNLDHSISVVGLVINYFRIRSILYKTCCFVRIQNDAARKPSQSAIVQLGLQKRYKLWGQLSRTPSLDLEEAR